MRSYSNTRSELPQVLGHHVGPTFTPPSHPASNTARISSWQLYQGDRVKNAIFSLQRDIRHNTYQTRPFYQAWCTLRITKRGLSIKPGALSGFAKWPKSNRDGSQRWLRYCFKTVADYDDLAGTFFPAVAMWLPAMLYSSLRIRPAYACGSNEKCICFDMHKRWVVEKDVLVILRGKPGVHIAITGYWFGLGDKFVPSDHIFRFQPADASSQNAAKTLTSAHELGISPGS
jgi:hypothetical protein